MNGRRWPDRDARRGALNVRSRGEGGRFIYCRRVTEKGRTEVVGDQAAHRQLRSFKRIAKTRSDRTFRVEVTESPRRRVTRALVRL